MRAALYARFSSDRQNERSIADQVELCQRRADEKGWAVVRIFSDAAISGSAMANRPGLLDAIAAAERGEIDILLCEDEDRIARDLEHLAHVANRFRDCGAALHTLSSGEVLTMHVAIKGLIAEDFIRNLSAKTKRGMHSNAEKGMATGARTYGYATQPGGHIEIVDDQADVVRRICRDYAAGATPRDIANALNREGEPSPMGGLWNASTIGGQRKRGTGILHCELYAGVKVWNRYDVKKDRRTGKRISKAIPADQWKRVDVPHLRIVDDETWAKVRARKDARRSPSDYRRYPGLFSGLLKCGLCGGTYTVYSSDRLVCATFREKGESACYNRRTPSRSKIEASILDGLREQLASPEAVAGYVRAYHQAAAARKSDKAARVKPLARRLDEIDRSLGRLVSAIERGTATASMESRVAELEREKTGLAAELEAVATTTEPIDLIPSSGEAYIAMIEHLQAELAELAKGDSARQVQLRDAVRGLIDRIVIIPKSQDRGAPVDVMIVGRLNDFLQSASAKPDQTENGLLGPLVAGAGIVLIQHSVHVLARRAV